MEIKTKIVENNYSYELCFSFDNNKSAKECKAFVKDFIKDFLSENDPEKKKEQQIPQEFLNFVKPSVIQPEPEPEAETKPTQVVQPELKPKPEPSLQPNISDPVKSPEHPPVVKEIFKDFSFEPWYMPDGSRVPVFAWAIVISNGNSFRFPRPGENGYLAEKPNSKLQIESHLTDKGQIVVLNKQDGKKYSIGVRHFVSWVSEESPEKEKSPIVKQNPLF